MTVFMLPHHVAASVAFQQLPAEVVRSPGVPATPDVEAGAPYPDPVVFGGQADTIFACPPLLDPSLAPLPVPTAQTPVREDRPQLDFGFIDANPTTNVSLPSPTVIRTAHGLRLPSFDALGIAAPHPDRMPLRSEPSFSSTIIGAGPLSKPEDPLHALSPPLNRGLQAETGGEAPVITSPRAARAQVEHIIPTFTPPSEPGTFSWSALVRTVGVGSPPSSEPGASPNLTLTASTGEASRAPIIVPTPSRRDEAVDMAAWVEFVKDTISKLVYPHQNHCTDHYRSS